MHDWHSFDVERGYDVKQQDEGTWLLRDREGTEWSLTAEEFNLLRSTGDNPKGIQ